LHRRLSTILLVSLICIILLSSIAYCDLLASWNFSGDTVETVPLGWTEDHPSNNYFRAKLDGSNMIANLNHTNANVTTSVNYSSFTAITTSNTSTITFDIKPLSTYDYDYIVFHNHKTHATEGIFLSFHSGAFEYYNGAWQIIIDPFTVGQWYHVYIYNIDLTNQKFDLDLNGTNKFKRGGMGGTVSSIGYVTLEGGGNEIVNDDFDNIVITNSIGWHNPILFNYDIHTEQYSNILLNYQIHTKQYSNILSNFMLHTEQFSNIISNFMLQTKGFHDIFSNFMIFTSGLFWHHIGSETLIYGNATLFTGGLLDENFVLLIILLIICIVLCAKRIPIIGVLMGLITFFICVTIIVFDTDIPANPTISILVALIGVVTIMLNVLKFRETK
jgi:hypothetical protein